MSYKDLKSMNWSGREKTQTRGRTLTTWTRLLGQLCRIPNNLALTLKAGKKGCYIVKFSNDGRYDIRINFYLYFIECLYW